MIEQENLEISNQGDFWSQVPVVLFTIAAVVAIVLVNKHTEAAALPSAAAPAAAIEAPLTPVVHPSPADCATCGEVIAVRVAEEEGGANSSQKQGAVVLDVRMTDGTVRTIAQPAQTFEVGNHVRLEGEALVARN
jgi:hypothetical protein